VKDARDERKLRPCLRCGRYTMTTAYRRLCAQCTRENQKVRDSVRIVKFGETQSPPEEGEDG